MTDAILTALGIVGAVTVYNLLAVMALRERLSKLEEWMRQAERRNGTR